MFNSGNNNMNFQNYLLTGVRPSEFEELKSQEQDIVSGVMEGFNDVWKPKVQGIKTSFKYNPSRSTIGIYIERNGQPQLVVEGQGLNKAEDAVVGSLYLRLERQLDRIRLPKEKWVDSVSQ